MRVDSPDDFYHPQHFVSKFLPSISAEHVHRNSMIVGDSKSVVRQVYHLPNMGATLKYSSTHSALDSSKPYAVTISVHGSDEALSEFETLLTAAEKKNYSSK